MAPLGRAVSVLHTEEKLRAVAKERSVTPESVEKYLTSKFGEALPQVRAAIEQLTKSRTPEVLAEEAFRLYEAFRPGNRGGGQRGR